ncbi:MAG TPA: hypothetical protein PKD49_06235 [Hyphomicrobium sp.]|nr:hypothetical protein [Hyphomicrobium sp.]
MSLHTTRRSVVAACALAAAFVTPFAVHSAHAAAGRQTLVLSGGAAIHDIARYGGRYCFADHVHYGASTDQPTKAKAKSAAIQSWFELVDLEYGAQWSSYAVSAKKDLSCTQSGTSWGCEVRAIPCSR